MDRVSWEHLDLTQEQKEKVDEEYKTACQLENEAWESKSVTQPEMKRKIVHLPPNIEIHMLEDILSEKECADIISQHEDNLDDISHIYGSEFRVNSRCRFESDDLAKTLWTRVSSLYEEVTLSFSNMRDFSYGDWKASGINNHFRLCRYTSGGKFASHYDARKLLDSHTQTMLTLNIYLNTVSEDAGGSTRILALSSQANSATAEEAVIYKVQPRTGLGCVFGDSVLHDGEELRKDEKWLLRTDIIFTRPAYNLHSLFLDGMSKALVAHRMAVALEDNGNTVDAVQWYKTAFALDGRLEEATTYITQAGQLEEKGDFAGAIELYTEAFRLCPALEGA